MPLTHLTNFLTRANTMNTHCHHPWTRLNRFRNELDRLFEPVSPPMNASEDNSHVVTCDWVPTVDIKEEQNSFVLYADIPGVDPKAVEITMEKGVLTLKGERNGEAREIRNHYKRAERAWGAFYRRFSLPDTADPEHITAKALNGVLEVTIPKRTQAQARKIVVES